MSALLESLAAGFDAVAGGAVPALAAVRRQALDQALADGLPAPRTERWKYTSLRALERRRFQPVEVLPELTAADLELPPAPRLVFVNGWLAPTLSDTVGLPEGVSLRALSEVLTGSADAAALFEGEFPAPDDTFARLNTALATEGVVLHAAAGARCDAPIHLLFLGQPDGEDRSVALRHRIELEAGASLVVVEEHRALGEHRHLDNALARILLAPRSDLVHVRLQQDAPGAIRLLRTEATLEESSYYHRLDLELGASLSRHELNVRLQGDDAHLDANGVLLGQGARHLDTRLGIVHDALGTECGLHWRGLATERSRVVFHGGIVIEEGADRTEAHLTNKNLLLSEQAEVDSQPVLEIYADEVQATHGATVGSLDEMALFYLRSRGLNETEARRLLTAAFCREVLALLGDAPLREQAEALLDRQLESFS